MKQSLLLILLFIYGICFQSLRLLASDTLKLSIAEAQQRLQQRNLPLIAQRYNIDIAKAYVIQSRLWDNPNISIEQNTYNPTNSNIPLDVSNASQFTVQFQQLFRLAAKRQKQIALAATSVQAQEYQFELFLRTLNQELILQLCTINTLEKNLKVYQQEQQTIDRLISVYEDQLKKGNIPLVVVTRLKALVFELQNEKKEIFTSLLESQQVIKLIIGDTTAIFISPIISRPNAELLATLNINELYESALINRPDYKLQQTLTAQQRANVSLQQSLAVPDLQVGAVFDRNGNAWRNYSGITFSIDLPFFNRNQGNISMAKLQLEQHQVLEEYKTRTVYQEIVSSVKQFQLVDSLIKNFDEKFILDFDKMINGVIESYQKQNISLVEFLDYFETYRQSRLRLNNLQLNSIENALQLNFAVGTTIIPIN